MRNTSFKYARGQGMTEYIIIVALIAVGAIGVYNLLGKTVRQQTSAMALGLAGNNTAAATQSTNAGTSATGSATAAEKVKNLSDFTQDSDKK